MKTLEEITADVLVALEEDGRFDNPEIQGPGQIFVDVGSQHYEIKIEEF
jgi:hypothetical protein